MIYVLKTKTNDVIVFDSITSFSESYGGSVTSHPIEDGNKISDHMITENLKVKIQGVVSDYNFYNPLKDYANTSIPAYDYPRTPSVMSLNTNNVVETANKEVNGDYAGKDNDGNFSVKASATVVKQRLIQLNRDKEFITILGYDIKGKDSVVSKWENCVITDVAFDENQDSGYAFYPSLTIEQVKVVRVVVEDANADVIKNNPSLGEQAASNKAKGDKDPSSVTDDTTKKPVKSILQVDLENERDRLEERARCHELLKSVKDGEPYPACAYAFGFVKNWNGVGK